MTEDQLKELKNDMEKSMNKKIKGISTEEKILHIRKYIPAFGREIRNIIEKYKENLDPQQIMIVLIDIATLLAYEFASFAPSGKEAKKALDRAVKHFSSIYQKGEKND